MHSPSSAATLPHAFRRARAVNAPVRQVRALLLAAVALLGLLVTPLLHAQEHWLEDREDEAESAAIAEAWRAGSTDPLEALASALAHVHELHRHEPQEHSHHHSHDPAGPGPHGAGAIAHLGIALHAAPRLPELAVPPPVHGPPAPISAQLRGTLAYLVPEWSQGPPTNC